MTYNEIVKALEDCVYKDAPLAYHFKPETREYNMVTANDLLSLITRQKAEITSLNKANLSIIEHLKKARKQLKTTKYESIKEFAQQVQAEIKDAMESNYKAKEERVAKCKKYGIPIVPDDSFLMYCDGKNHALSGIDYFIDNLVKEMVGDDNGNL